MQSPRRSLSSTTTENSPDSKIRGSLDTQYEAIHNIRAADPAQRAPRSAEYRTNGSLVGTKTSATENPSFPFQMSQYFLMELDPRRADIILIVCGFVGGLVDGLSFNAWGNFSSMQTGMFSKSSGAVHPG